MSRKIYLASSWRNADQPEAVRMLRNAGHEVYDFRHPKPGDSGFSWGDIAVGWLDWTPEEFIESLKHPTANAGFSFDKDALDWCDTCVLLLPCGRSAHLEAGYAIGHGKPTLIVLSPERFEPELMYKLAETDAAYIVPSLDQMLSALETLSVDFQRRRINTEEILRYATANVERLSRIADAALKVWDFQEGGVNHANGVKYVRALLDMRDALHSAGYSTACHGEAFAMRNEASPQYAPLNAVSEDSDGLQTP